MGNSAAPAGNGFSVKPTVDRFGRTVQDMMGATGSQSMLGGLSSNMPMIAPNTSSAFKPVGAKPVAPQFGYNYNMGKGMIPAKPSDLMPTPSAPAPVTTPATPAPAAKAVAKPKKGYTGSMSSHQAEMIKQKNQESRRLRGLV